MKKFKESFDKWCIEEVNINLHNGYWVSINNYTVLLLTLIVAVLAIFLF